MDQIIRAAAACLPGAVAEHPFEACAASQQHPARAIDAAANSRAVPAVTLVLPYPISANRYWTSFRIGDRQMLAPSKEAKAYKRHVGDIALAAGVRKPLLGRVQIDICLYPERPQDWKRRAAKDPLGWDDTVRCLDLDNARKVLYDSLTGVVIEDDKWVRRDSGERMEPDEHGARVVVVVTSLVSNNPQKDLL
jgi:crossover junction endodeoxyribonuclease RusA